MNAITYAEWQQKLITAATENCCNSNAAFCLAEANQRLQEGNGLGAKYWAKRSLEYSVGVFHPIFKELGIA